ncbi:hypothetical protein [Caminibacter sp.]
MKELFISYSKEEVDFLLSLFDENINDVSSVEMFRNLDKNEFLKFERLKLNKKDIIKNYTNIWVLKGEIAIVKNGKIVKKISNGGYFCKMFNDSNEFIIALKKSEIIDFDFDEKNYKVLNEILRYLLKNQC